MTIKIRDKENDIRDRHLLGALDNIVFEEGSKGVLNILPGLPKETYINNFLLVYGSLRKKQYNYLRLRHNFGKESFVYIDTVEISNARMFDLGDYPVTTGGAYNDIVIAEVMYCSNKVFKTIQAMEEGAGYRKIETGFWTRDKGWKSKGPTEISYYIAGKRLFEELTQAKYPRVESGDWVKYLTAVEEIK